MRLKEVRFMGDSKRLAVIFAIISLIAAIMASFLFLNFIRENEARFGDTIEVMVAAKDIPPLTTITEDMITPLEVPREIAGNISFASRKEIINKTTIAPLLAKEVVNNNVLKDNATPINSRVIQLRSPVAVFDGEFRPGDNVDIIVSYKDREQDLSEIAFTGAKVANFTTAKGESSSAMGIILPENQIEKMIWMLNYGKEVRVVKS